MKVREYLAKNKSDLDVFRPIELRDIIDERIVYTGRGYRDLLKALEAMPHVREARFVAEGEKRDDIIVLLYVKDINEYDDFDLQQLADKLAAINKED